jgi:hypothetical protein
MQLNLLLIKISIRNNINLHFQAKSFSEYAIGKYDIHKYRTLSIY